MSENPRKPQSDDDDRIEREIRAGRKFSVAEALGRSAGELLKGASPATRKRQAEAAIEGALERHLHDSEGSLAIVLRREAAASEELLRDYDRPIDGLIRVVERLLGSEERLSRFVTRIDAEWGRIYSERPHFEREHQPPDADDPYTISGVRDRLSDLLASLRETTDRQP